MDLKNTQGKAILKQGRTRFRKSIGCGNILQSRQKCSGEYGYKNGYEASGLVEERWWREQSLWS